MCSADAANVYLCARGDQVGAEEGRRRGAVQIASVGQLEAQEQPAQLVVHALALVEGALLSLLQKRRDKRKQGNRKNKQHNEMFV